MEIIVSVGAGQLKRFSGQNEAGYDEEDMDHWSAGIDDSDKR